MKNVIINAFAVDSEKCGGANIQAKKSLLVYLKNICVSLQSAKINNPMTDVILVSNFKIPEPFCAQLERAGIGMIEIAFSCFNVPSSFVWSLAYFKLCALKYMAENTHYDNILLIDTDTVCMKEFREIWEETESSILLYNVHSNYWDDVRQGIVRDYEKLYGEKKNLQHYGGEFVCGNRILLNTFLSKCEAVYEKIKNSGFDMYSLSGDEMILSIAAEEMADKIIESNPYIGRFWTGLEYLVDTRCYQNILCVWHFPGEKELGMIRLYKYLQKNHALPEKKKLYKYFGLPKNYRPDLIKYCLKNFIFLCIS